MSQGEANSSASRSASGKWLLAEAPTIREVPCNFDPNALARVRPLRRRMENSPNGLRPEDQEPRPTESLSKRQEGSWNTRRSGLDVLQESETRSLYPRARQMRFLLWNEHVRSIVCFQICLSFNFELKTYSGSPPAAGKCLDCLKLSAES